MLWVTRGLIFGLLFGGSIWLGFRALSGLGFGLACGLAFGITIGLLTVIERRPTAVNTPSQLVHQGWIHDITILLMFNLALGLAVGITAWFSFEFVHGFIGAFLGTFVFASAFGMCWLSRSPWPQYLVATHILAQSGQLPPQLSHFLDWAYAAGLLRLSGISIQFRHRELQDYLTSNPLP